MKWGKVSKKKEGEKKGSIVIRVYNDALPEFEFSGNLVGKDIALVRRKFPRAYHMWQRAKRR